MGSWRRDQLAAAATYAACRLRRGAAAWLRLVSSRLQMGMPGLVLLPAVPGAPIDSALA